MEDITHSGGQAISLGTEPLDGTQINWVLEQIREAEGPWVASYVQARVRTGETSESKLDRLVDRARDEQGRCAAKLSASVSTIRLGYGSLSR